MTDESTFAVHLREVTRMLAPALRAAAIAVPSHAATLTAAAARCEAEATHDAAKAAKWAAYAALEWTETHYAQRGAHALADEVERACSAASVAWVRHADGWPGPMRQEIGRAHIYARSSRVRAWLGIDEAEPADASVPA